MSRESNQAQLSIHLSNVLNDIGISHDVVMKTRELALVKESARRLSLRNSDKINVQKVGFYNFGSQTEASTTLGLNSDEDLLTYSHHFNVIDDMSYLKDDMENLLMVQDSTAPGYCYLQYCEGNMFQLREGVFCTDEYGRTLLKHIHLHKILVSVGVQNHGPASTFSFETDPTELDVVAAIYCDQWPKEAQTWLFRNNTSNWPDRELKDRCEKSGCFVVQVANKLSSYCNQGIEWRISTSLAERYLMFSLKNIHTKCYVLMKMLVKSNAALNGKISSFMCKTALFHSVENTPSEIWRENNLLYCFNHTVWLLYNFVYYRNCPHFIIPENNLLAWKLTAAERERILEVLLGALNSEGNVLFEIDIDKLGKRLQMKLDGHFVSSEGNARFTNESKVLLLNKYVKLTHVILIWFVYVINMLESSNNNGKSSTTMLEALCMRYLSHYPISSTHDQQAYKCIMPLLCSLRGSLLASYYKSEGKSLPQVVWDCLEKGCESDVSSGRLKLATVCYSVGELERAEKILREVDLLYDRNVVLPISAYYFDRQICKKKFFHAIDQLQQIPDFYKLVSYSVAFYRGELNIVPTELQKLYQHNIMFLHDVAVFDSLPYLYFLQYKTYGRLGNQREQKKAVRNLQEVIDKNEILYHKDTALFLLGVIMRQENLPEQAMKYFKQSLDLSYTSTLSNNTDVDRYVIAQGVLVHHMASR